MMVESKDDVLLASLVKFYSTPAHIRQLTDAMRNDTISLRVLDWFVTNYSKRCNVTYPIVKDGETRSFNVFLEYKSQLKGFSKRLFDPFARRTRIAFDDADGRALDTTIGQLNFFRWAISNGVLTFSVAHAEDIERDMLHCIKHRQHQPKDTTTTTTNAGGPEEEDAAKPKRRELSRAAIKSLTQTKVILTLRFQ